MILLLMHQIVFKIMKLGYLYMHLRHGLVVRRDVTPLFHVVNYRISQSIRDLSCHTFITFLNCREHGCDDPYPS